MPIYSHSRISTFEQCPLKYKFQYIDKIKVEQEDTIETFLGSRVHETLEKLYKDLKFEKHLTLKELLAYFNDIWKRNLNKNTMQIHVQEKLMLRLQRKNILWKTIERWELGLFQIIITDINHLIKEGF